ncbi:MAG TPA: YfhO family protein [Pirellulales bacterium]|nr:YfhO family protein [Pirellulales bacterium]
MFQRPLSHNRLWPWATGAVCLAPFVALLAPGDRVLPSCAASDYAALQLPVHQFIRDEILAGRVPLWIPWLGGGTPLHASCQAGVFYPGLTLPLLLRTPNSALKLCLFIHLLLAFVGEYRLARVLGASRAGSSLAAATLAESGFMVNHLMAGHVGIVIGASHLPWFLWALQRLLREPGPLRAATVGAIGALLVCGSHPQVAYYGALASTAWTAVFVAATKPRRERWRQIAWAAAAAAIALLMGAVQLVPTLELLVDGLADSRRAGVAFASSGALNQLDLIRLLLPDIAGNPFRAEPPIGAWGGLFHERVMYLGLGSPLLAIYGLTRLEVKGWQWVAAWLTATGFITALGDATPWFALLGRIVPAWFSFRCPGRVFAIVTPLVGVLAARGFDALLARERAGWRERWWLTPAAAWVAASLTVLADSDPIHVNCAALIALDWRAGRWDTVAGLALACTTAAAITVVACSKKVMVAPIVCTLFALLLGDLGYNNAQNVRTVVDSPAGLPAELLAVNPPIRFVDAPNYPHSPEPWLSCSRMVRAAVEARRSMVGTNDGGILPVALARYHRAVSRRPTCALAASGCCYAYNMAERTWQPIPNALPRTRFTTGSAAKICGVGIERLTPGALGALRTASRPVTVRYEDARRVVMEVNTAHDGMLVVADTLYPGWSCTVDGFDVPVEPVHGVFRGVRLLAGKRTIEMVYAPRSFTIGAAGSVLGTAFFLVLATLGRCRRPASRGFENEPLSGIMKSP